MRTLEEVAKAVEGGNLKALKGREVEIKGLISLTALLMIIQLAKSVRVV